jgi:hypothetical protein
MAQLEGAFYKQDTPIDPPLKLSIPFIHAAKAEALASAQLGKAAIRLRRTRAASPGSGINEQPPVDAACLRRNRR